MGQELSNTVVCKNDGDLQSTRALRINIFQEPVEEMFLILFLSQFREIDVPSYHRSVRYLPFSNIININRLIEGQDS